MIPNEKYRLIPTAEEVAIFKKFLSGKTNADSCDQSKFVAKCILIPFEYVVESIKFDDLERLWSYITKQIPTDYVFLFDIFCQNTTSGMYTSDFFITVYSKDWYFPNCIEGGYPYFQVEISLRGYRPSEIHWQHHRLDFQNNGKS